MNVAYLAINVLVLAGVLTGLILRRSKPTKATWLTLAALLVLTAVFDNVIVGLGIVTYDHARILGLFVGHAPIEDFFYPIAAALLIPALWSGREE